ncbi:hypothetical protein FG05_35120 [Fusarium graminearum]|nr:hypothetical protein FG05_35120 [Fusarium graminearum]
MTTPSISSRKHRCSTYCEWFSKEKATKSAPVAPEYLLYRYCWIYHSPKKKKTAGMRMKYEQSLRWAYSRGGSTGWIRVGTAPAFDRKKGGPGGLSGRPPLLSRCWQIPSLTRRGPLATVETSGGNEEQMPFTVVVDDG